MLELRPKRRQPVSRALTDWPREWVHRWYGEYPSMYLSPHGLIAQVRALLHR
jgi:hypothetical protein